MAAPCAPWCGSRCRASGWNAPCITPLLTDGPTWDCAAVSLRAIDQNGNLLPYCGEAVCLSVEGPLKILGPSVVPLRGGMAGTYLATTGKAGRAVLHCRMEGALDTEAVLTVRCREEQNV